MNNAYLFEKEPMSKHNINLGSTILGRFGASILFGLIVLSLGGCGGGDSGSGSSMQIRPPSGNGPDLIIQSISVNDNTLTPGQRFTVSITVRNQGNRRSAATTLQRDGGSTVSVPSLAPSEISPVTRYSLTAGSSGNISACVTPVSGESNTRNNCGEVSVTVNESTPNPPASNFPSEISPTSPPQESGTDIRGIEVAGLGTTEALIVRNQLGSRYTIRAGTWYEPKDGNAQRMIVTRTITVPSGQIAQVPAACMQERKPVPPRGLRFFSQFKSIRPGVQTCQRNCLSGSSNIQGCVWSCERSSPPPPTQTNWGSIYFSFNGDGSYNWELDYGSTQSVAENNARNACRVAGGRNCRRAITTPQCGALAVGSENGRVNFFRGGSGSTISEAERDAIIQCRNGGGQNCRIDSSRSGGAASFCAN